MPDIVTTLVPPAQITTALQPPPGITTTLETPAPITTTLVNGQGPAGAPGMASPALQTDYTGVRFWYLLYPQHITRLDQSVSPALVQVSSSTDWPNRATLPYT